MTSPVEEEGNLYRFVCPHCNITIEVEKKKTNCCIFRCGMFKANGKQIPSHTKKPECDRLFSQGLIQGCSRPFRFVRRENGNYVEICDYI